MDALLKAVDSYGIAPVTILFLIYMIYQMAGFNVRKSIKALDANTEEIKKLRKDLRVAFKNIRTLREKAGIGELENLTDLEQ